MKAFAFVLLCALAAVQGRYAPFQSTRDLTDLDDNPWVVHLRIAVSTSGTLNSGAGSLIADNWVLTTAENVVNGRFIWVRLGVVNVNSPSLVAETSTVTINPDYDPATGANNVALVNTGMNVVSDPNIQPIPLVSAIVIGPGKVCIFGPRGVLRCFRVNVAKDDHAGLIISGGDVQVTDHDFGTPLVTEDGQIGLLVGLPPTSDDGDDDDDDGDDGDDGDNDDGDDDDDDDGGDDADDADDDDDDNDDDEEIVGQFLATDIYLDWIEAETGVILNPEPLPDADPAAVHFVQ